MVADTKPPVCCSSCGAEISVFVQTQVEQAQRMTMTIDAGGRNRFIEAREFGECLAAWAKVLEGVGKSMGQPVVCFLNDLKLEPGKVTITIMVANGPKKPKKGKA